MSEQKYYHELIKEMGHIAKIGGWEFNALTGEGTWTEETAKIHEVDPKDKTDMAYGISFYQESSRKKIEAAIDNVIRTGTPYDIELELTTAKGHHKWIRTIGKPIFEGGKVIKVRGSFQDITKQKTTEAALRESEEKFRFIAESSIDCIWQMDLNLRFIYLSPSLYPITGFKPEEWIGTKLSSHTSPKEFLTMSKYALDMIAHYKTFEHVTFETKMYNKSGDLIPLEISAKPLIIEGKLQGLQGSTRDIHEKVLSHEKLLDSEAKYRHLFETMDQGVVYQNKQGEIISANPAAERILGLTLEQMKGRTSVDPRWKAVDKDSNALPGDKHPAMLSLKKGKKIQNFLQGIYNPKLNDYVWVIINSMPLYRKKEKEPYGVYSTFLDITERRQAAIELRQNEKKLSSLFENMNEGFALHQIVTDKKGKAIDYIFLDMNKSFEQMTGLKRKDIIGKKVTQVIPGIEKDPANWIGRYGKITKENITMIFEDYSEPLDKWYIVSAFSPQKDQFATTIFDITQRKKIEEELKQLKNELEEKVYQQTFKLKEQLKELEHFRDATIDREFRMKELREELEELKNKSGH